MDGKLKLRNCFLVLAAALSTTMLCGQIIYPIFFHSPGFVSAWTVNNNKIGSSAASAAAVPTSAFTNSLVNGSIIIVGTSAGVPSSSGQLVTDLAGNIYSLVGAGSQFAPGTPNTWCASNTHTTPSNIVTLALVGGFSFSAGVINATEIFSSQGAVTCGGNQDDAGGNLTTTASAAANNGFCGSGGRLNLTHPGDFVFLWANVGGGTIAAGTSPFMFTLLNTSTVNTSIAEYYVQPTILSGFIGTFSVPSSGETFQSFCMGYHP